MTVLKKNSDLDPLVNVATGDSVNIRDVSDTTNQATGETKGITQRNLIRWVKGADIASASALSPGADGNAFDITGTNAITSINTIGIGTFILLHFDAILTLTHHATNLILPNGENITTVAGGEGMFYEYDTGKWRCISYSPVSMGTASEIHGASSKATPVDADELGLVDSAASWVLKKLTWANLKATLKTYFDTLYAKFFGNAYYPDYNEADQGLTGNGKSAKAYIDTIASDSATLVFRHNSGAATTTYTFSTNETVPSNIHIIIEEGAILSFATGITLTVYKPENITARKNQKIFIWAGTGKIAFTVPGRVFPEWWGIDGAADEVQIQAAIDANPGGIIELNPAGGYVTAAGFTISDNSTHLYCSVLNSHLITSSADIYMLTIDDCLYAKLTNIGLYNTHGAPTKANLLIAGKAKNLDCQRLFAEGNKYGIQFDRTQGSVPGGIFYNEFYHTEITGSTGECVYFTNLGSGENENYFFGGNLHNSNTNKLIRVTGNNNKFIGGSLESAVAGAVYTEFAVTDNGIGNVFAFLRFETDGLGILVDKANTDESKGTQIYGNFWSCDTVRVAVKDGIAFSDTAGKDMTFKGMIKAGPTLSTTVDVQSASGQNVVSCAATAGFYEGQAVVLDKGNANEEWHIINSINVGVSITFFGNLDNTHAIGVAVDGHNSLSGMRIWPQNDVSTMDFWEQGKCVMRLDGLSATAGDDAGIFIYDTANATLTQVFFGAADSGGAGFRMLRVAN